MKPPEVGIQPQYHPNEEQLREESVITSRAVHELTRLISGGLHLHTLKGKELIPADISSFDFRPVFNRNYFRGEPMTPMVIVSPHDMTPYIEIDTLQSEPHYLRIHVFPRRDNHHIIHVLTPSYGFSPENGIVVGGGLRMVYQMKTHTQEAKIAAVSDGKLVRTGPTTYEPAMTMIFIDTVGTYADSEDWEVAGVAVLGRTAEMSTANVVRTPKPRGGHDNRNSGALSQLADELRYQEEGDPDDDREDPPQDGLTPSQAAILTGWFDEFDHGLFRYVLKRLNDEKVAEDIVSKAWVKTAEMLVKGKGPKTNVRSWLYQTVAHFLVDHVRDVQKHAELLDESHVTDKNAVERNVEDGIRDEVIRRILEDMEPDQRQILIDRFVTEMGTGEIAQRMKIRENAASVRINRAKTNVGHRLARLGFAQ